MVPEEGKTLGDVCDVTKLAGFEYTSHFDYSVGGEIIAVRSLNIKNGAFDFSDVQTIPKETSQALPRSKLRGGDIVMGYVGTIGNAAMVTEDDHLHLAPNVALIRPKPAHHPMFVFQQVLGPNFQQQLSILTTTTSQPALSMTNLRKAKFWLPSLPEQRKIADILSTWDQAIEKTEALLSNARTQKRGLMQQLLTGKRRFPAFEGQPWKEVKLGDVVKIDWGNTSITKKSYVDSGVDAYSAAGRDGYVADAERSGAGIVLSAIGARCGRCFWADGDWTAIKNTIVILEQPDHCDLRFLFQIVNDARFWPISGGAQPFIGLKNARNAKVKLPPLREQRRLAEILDTSDSLTADLVCDITKLRTEKKALMQQLLTGKRRVKVEDHHGV